VRHVWLFNNSLEDKHLSELFALLKKFPSLESVDLTANDISLDEVDMKGVAVQGAVKKRREQ